MYVITNEMEIVNTELFILDLAGCEWQAIYEAELIEAECTTILQTEALAAPVVALYTDSLPAQPAALNPFVAELVQSQDAIAATISELNMLVLNTANTDLRSQIKNVAAGLVAKAPLMEVTKANYLSMLEAAEANAAYYYGKPVQESSTAIVTAINPYKRKYDTATEISKHLATTSRLKEVASLYYVNAELIEQTSWLKQAFTDLKARLYRPSAAAA